ncbi:MAG: hypothetical protein K0R49_1794 [Burkholderiales bacterium]|jgi:hypothetical protein|nr:hypothetical protein [Burkholderiales bacterium]
MEVIYTYSRADSIADGMQKKCELASQAGFNFPVFITKGINDLVNESLKYGANSYNGVMWDMLSMLHTQIKRSQQDTDFIKFKVWINWKGNRQKAFIFVASVGALDVDKPQPAFTIMLPDED